MNLSHKHKTEFNFGPDQSYHLDRRMTFLAGAFILLIVAFNPLTVSKLLSADGILHPASLTKIWIIDIGFCVLGLGILRYSHFVSKIVKAVILFSERSPWTFLAAYFPFYLLVIFLTAEIVCAILYLVKEKYIMERSRYITVESSSIVERDDLFGIKHRSLATATTRILTVNNQLIRQFTYTTDRYGRRMTPVHGQETRDRFILFFGCSYTFGAGVNDDETLPFYLFGLTSAYRPYNYGIRGVGPQQMLMQFQRKRFQDEVPEAKGLLVYTFIDNHVERAIGSMSVRTWWGWDPPYYRFEDEKLVYKGSFNSAEPLLTKWYKFLERRYFFRYSGLDIPRIKERDIRLVSKIIEESKNLFEERFGSDGFYVIFYPGTKRASLFKPYFDELGIKYLDYTNLFDPTQKEWNIPKDGHPSPEAYKVIARRLVQDLKLND